MLNIKSKMLPPKRWLKRKKRENNTLSVESSLSSFAQKYLHKCKDTYFILQNKYLCIYEFSFAAKILTYLLREENQKSGNHCNK